MQEEKKRKKEKTEDTESKRVSLIKGLSDSRLDFSGIIWVLILIQKIRDQF